MPATDPNRAGAARDLWIYGLLVGVHLFLYLPYLWSSPYFVGDDLTCFTAARWQHSEPWASWIHRLGDRPLRHVYFQGMFALFGFNPLPFHLISALLQLVNTLLVVSLARALGQEQRVALTAGLLFSVHYMNTPVTLCARQVDTQLLLLFGLSCMLYFRRALLQGDRRSYLISLALYGASLLTIGLALVLPMVLVVLDRRWGGNAPGRATFKRLVPYFGLAGFFFLINLAFMVLFKFIIDQPLALSTPQLAILTLAQENLSRLLNLATHIKLFLVPFDFQGSGVEFWQPENHNPLLALGLLAPALVLLLSRASFAYRFCLLWFFLTLLPFLWSPFTPVKERYLYTPLAGGSILLAMVIWHAAGWFGRRVPWRGVAVGVIATAALATSLTIAWRGRALAWKEAGKISRQGTDMLHKTVKGRADGHFVFFLSFPTIRNRIALFTTSVDLLAAFYPEISTYGSAQIGEGIHSGGEAWSQLTIMDTHLPLDGSEEKKLKHVSRSFAAIDQLCGVVSAIPARWRIRVLHYSDKGVRDLTEQSFSRWRVTFRLDQPGARQVSVVGDFNGWKPAAGRLSRAAGGEWRGTFTMPARRYRYAVVVDGKQHKPGSEASCEKNGYCTPEAWLLPLVNQALPVGLFPAPNKQANRRLLKAKRRVLLFPGSRKAHLDLARLYKDRGLPLAAGLEGHTAWELLSRGIHE